MMPISANQPLSKNFISSVQQELDRMGRASVGVQAAMITTADGFEIATFRAGKSVSAKMAAMGSSIQALAQALAREANLDEMKNTVIEAKGGTVLVMAVNESRPRLTLAVVTNSSAILGQLIWSARECCAAIGKLTP